MSHDDFAFEPIPGLPARLPEGETILWQGSPQWWPIARRVFWLPWIALYFGALLVHHAMSAGASLPAVGAAIAPVLLLSAVALGILALLARAVARTTIYTITNRRVVMRFGMALPVTYNLPFKVIANAGVDRFGSGHGDIALGLLPGQRIAYLVLWPHARPWHVTSPQPLLRGLPEVEKVAAILARALEGHQTSAGTQPASAPAAAVKAPLRTVRFPQLAAAE